MAAQRLRRPAPRLHQCPLQEDGAALLGEDGNRLIRRTAVVRTRMPGGVGGAAPRGAPLSRLMRVHQRTTYPRTSDRQSLYPLMSPGGPLVMSPDTADGTVNESMQ